MSGERTLRLGFMPLTDSAALLAGQAMGFFADEGLDVALSREASWATVRDKLAVGALDAAQVLAPMPLAATLGAGSEPVPMAAPMILSRDGPAITVSSRLAAAFGPDGAQGLARLVARRREEGASPLTFAVVFPYSAHAYLLRGWMADAGLDLDRDVRLTVVPPPRTAELLAEGVIEGFCAGEPWNLLAEAAGAGRVLARAADLLGRSPDKALGISEAWGEAHPDVRSALVRALVRASAWVGAPENRTAVAELLARPEHLGQPVQILRQSLARVAFGENRPTAEDATWLAGQMRRWGQAGSEAQAAAGRVFSSQPFDQALRGA
ncbi:CmpA/NrtA family ABC transporter substrate-binding protein [Phenylobacterium sp.]|uniref:CmpA/NrtA family ABC transporter substrate-binding protein n=1 Tax=Phenylobacterium sp. TaxID=1871053 RepID=UPI002B54F228|nr:CmpA/NrtA family ABC transporter substrate-binding protein [Phenylobacterium sp.]HVI33852.1 CmpA/NrtA family ABC transporter substrate-binding protein [Phenylobacterium sp.]